jgi:hypothetical protein
MGAFCAGSYEVTPPRPFACNDAFRRADGSTERQQSLRQAYEESDPTEDVTHILTGLRDWHRRRCGRGWTGRGG